MSKGRALLGTSAILVLLGLGVLSAPAFGKARISDPAPRNTNDDNQTDCTGAGGSGGVRLPLGAVATTVKIMDNDSVGCIQIAVFDQATRVGDVMQQVDNVGTAREVTFSDVPIPASCRDGRRCTIHMRQLLVADAGACPPATGLGTGALGNRYSCADFRVAQPDLDAGGDAAPQPEVDASTPGVDSGFVPLPPPSSGDGGVVRVAGLDPSSAESESCAVTTPGDPRVGLGAASGVALATLGLVLAARRRRK